MSSKLDLRINRIVGWINTHFTHNQDKIGDFGIRATIHIVPGIIAGLLSLIHWSLTLAFVWVFIKYERNEDLHTEDEAWKDIFGFLIGLPIGGLIAFFLR